MGRIHEIAKAFRYTPTPEEKRWGLSSSVNSKGPVGKINRTIARLTRQKEVDVIGFLQAIGRPQT